MISSEEKIRIRQLDDKSDYALWRVRVKAAINGKKLGKVLTGTEPERNDTEKKEEASNIIVSAMSGQALRVVRPVIGNAEEMLEKLDDRYDSKSTASKIS